MTLRTRPPRRASTHLDALEVWLATWVPRLLMFFPIIDYALRLSPLTPLGEVWDKLAFASLVWVAVRRHRRGVRPPRQTWQKPALWFVVWIVALSAVGAADPQYAAAGAGFYIYYLMFAFVLPYAVSKHEARLLLHLLVGAAVLIALHAIYQYIIGVPIPSDWVDPDEHVRTRVFSVLKSPNELGSYMALMTPLLAGLAIVAQGRRRVFYGLGAVVCAVAMILTFTRGAWLGLAGALVISAIAFERRALVPLAILICGAFLEPGVRTRIGSLFTQVYWIKSADSGRIAKWLSAFDHMSTNPLLGAGIGRYGGAVATVHHLSTYSDSFYAKTLGEAGLIGLVLFFGMHVRLVLDLFRTLRRARDVHRYLYLGAITGVLAVLIHNAMENVFEYAPMALSYYTVATLALTAGSAAKGGEHAASRDTNEIQREAPVHG
ncbi:O-antigen ligase family protein [Alicyclobacillus kakegawensis]|uniref:O-antigen ligase family protein n=1 Tax=Alicyclobacillus kakegawensis TaxID=392012 RepID=UPI0009F88371|nr:O-antigen ligase family protein [Alicyclobacillus kakegawensis]